MRPGDRRLDGFDETRPAVAEGVLEGAYVYYTSGSTGRPKGILGTLRGLAHFVSWEIDTFGMRPGDRVSQLPPRI